MSEHLIGKEDCKRLIRAAKDAMQNAYAPYSKFPVGAALLLEDGQILTGSNVENASYGLCLCAERAAIGAAVSRGLKWRAVAVATITSPPSTPCGMCRQVLREFHHDLPILLIGGSDELVQMTLADLLPNSFGPAQLHTREAGLEDGVDDG